MAAFRSKWNMIWNIPRLIKTSWLLLKDPRVPGGNKLLLLLLGAGYLLWPFDLVPDVPLIGQLDDLGLIFLLLNWFVNRAVPDDHIEADYYFEEDEENKK
ncbi:MAG: YkvA family protein [Peptococcaceae bacterium]|jgi:uncharacterized membrane protein YkvA (DUF1232 family)|nr:YkvA family protein [Peptococcaceae bacterium]MDH7524126.1 YkvA family protein [Peptococcaceae bacterium]